MSEKFHVLCCAHWQVTVWGGRPGDAHPVLTFDKDEILFYVRFLPQELHV